MNVEPIINARFKRFRDAYELNDIDDGIAFEKFVNHAILSTHQPDAFAADSDLLESVSVGGSDDMGIDGIAVKLNGLLVTQMQDITDILERCNRATVEFIFIQSKYKNKFDSGEFNKFTAGVRDFLSEEHFLPANDKVKKRLEIKDYLLSDDVVVIWEKNPTVRLYYVAMGKWRDNQHVIGLAKKLQDDMQAMRTYDECHIHYVDAECLKIICDNNDNTFNATIEVIDSMPLAPVNKVENSCIAMCYANEFINLLRTEEGVIRKSLFNDNVRDFQGTNNVNREIEATVCDEPDKFGLLNNGITIVCDEFIPSNRRITLKNPQIVNGCQTSNVLFNAAIAQYDISKIPLQIKIISTRDIEIINQIVRGTNRQNIVLDEAFETTRQFHKDLEEFFLVLSNKYGRIYYERRSRQYQNDPRIKQTEKVNLRIITQSFVGMYLNMPHMSHRHEAKLLKEYEDKLYQEHHSKLPYFTASLTFVKLESLFRKNKIDRRSFYSFRAHLMMLFREILAGSVPNIDNEKLIDDNCEKILTILNDEQKTEEAFNRCIEVFERAKNIWGNKMMKSVFGMKDIADFTVLLLKEAGNNGMINITSVPCGNILSGRVIKVFIDRNGAYCGFIERHNGNLFFHSAMNQNLDFRKLKGEMVSYRLSTNRQGPVAIGVKRLDKTN